MAESKNRHEKNLKTDSKIGAKNSKDEINISALKKNSDLKNTVVDDNKQENKIDDRNRRVGGEQKRK